MALLKDFDTTGKQAMQSLMPATATRQTNSLPQSKGLLGTANLPQGTGSTGSAGLSSSQPKGLLASANMPASTSRYSDYPVSMASGTGNVQSGERPMGLLERSLLEAEQREAGKTLQLSDRGILGRARAEALGTLDENKGTVEGRTASILDQNSPLMQRASSSALESANQRGLLNSSMAVGAAQGAVMDYATKIASQDASAYNTQQLANQQYQQQQGLLAQQNDYTRSNMGLENQYNQDNLKLQNQLQQQLNQQGFDFNVQLENLQSANELRQMDAQTVANTYGAYMTSIQDLIKQWQISVNEIQISPDVSAADKTSMINEQGQMLQSQMEFYKSLYNSVPTWVQGWTQI